MAIEINPERHTYTTARVRVRRQIEKQAFQLGAARTNKNGV